uniref:Uncharacterized protein n=1 Tax=Meloidogyne floridensis TaxID=298350 RepID=A0A915P470_9BILA
MQLKQQNKKLPLELLVDIFEGIDGEIIELSKVFKKQKSMVEQKECEKLWVNRVNSLILEEREFVEKIERLKEEEQLLEEREKQTKRLEKSQAKIIKRQKAEKEMEENSPVAKRTRSHFRLKEEEQLLEERVDLLEDETCELRKQIAKLFEEKRKKLNVNNLNYFFIYKKFKEKQTKRLEKSQAKIIKRQKAEKEMEENSPIAKRTRSHFSSKEIKK